MAPKRPSPVSWIAAKCRITEGFGAAAGLTQITAEPFAAWFGSQRAERACRSRSVHHLGGVPFSLRLPDS